MNKSSVVHNTFVIERNYPQPPRRVFAAFADAERKRRWFAEGEGHEVEAFRMDFRVGGHEHARYRFAQRTPFANVVFAHEASYLDIVPEQRVAMVSTMSLGSQRMSAALITYEFLSMGTGTYLICTHQGVYFEGADGPKVRESGMRQLLEQLARELARG